MVIRLFAETIRKLSGKMNSRPSTLLDMSSSNFQDLSQSSGESIKSRMLATLTRTNNEKTMLIPPGIRVNVYSCLPSRQEYDDNDRKPFVIYTELAAFACSQSDTLVVDMHSSIDLVEDALSETKGIISACLIYEFVGDDVDAVGAMTSFEDLVQQTKFCIIKELYRSKYATK